MSVQVCPYHDRLQKDFNGMTEVVGEIREWKAVQDERQKYIEEKIDQAIVWMKWAVGLSITTAIAMLGTVATLLVK